MTAHVEFNSTLAASGCGRRGAPGRHTLVKSDIAITGFNPNADVQQITEANFAARDTGYNFGHSTNSVLSENFVKLNLANGGKELVSTVKHNYASLNGLSSNSRALGGAMDKEADGNNAQATDFIAALDINPRIIYSAHNFHYSFQYR
jgi:hypothetical protein